MYGVSYREGCVGLLGEPVSPNDHRVLELNQIAMGVMDSRYIIIYIHTRTPLPVRYVIYIQGVSYREGCDGESRKITVVDMYATMTACGKLCSGCKPHCSNP
jgi:hypothetical protein